MKITIPIEVEFDNIQNIIDDLNQLQTYKLSEGDEMMLVDIDDVADILAAHVKAKEPERKPGRWIETEGLDEEIRCLMCTNHMRSDRGCDGACQYDEHVYKEIMSALERRMMEVEHEGG